MNERRVRENKFSTKKNPRKCVCHAICTRKNLAIHFLCSFFSRNVFELLLFQCFRFAALRGRLSACVFVCVLYSLPSVLVCISFRLPIYFFACFALRALRHSTHKRYSSSFFIYFYRKRQDDANCRYTSVGLVFFSCVSFFLAF